MNEKLHQAAGSGVSALANSARTVTGNNLLGPVRVITMSEVQALVESVAAQHTGLDEAAQAKLKAELEAKHLAEETELHRRIADLERQLQEAAAAQAAAVAAAQLAAQARIKELETILAKDDARLRLAFLEQEVARLQALIDRYEAGLEFITTVEQPSITVDLELADTLSSQTGPELMARIQQIKIGLQGGAHVMKEGLAMINEQRKGSIYGVTDLIEHSVNLTHWHNELLSIKQALAKT